MAIFPIWIDHPILHERGIINKKSLLQVYECVCEWVMADLHYIKHAVLFGPAAGEWT